jgi:phosphoribosylformylglycinamidine cyclo-ligase
LGGFAGLYDISGIGLKEPILVSSTDGVGTKLKIAISADKLNTIGIDLVAMSVNDILVTGAQPLFFLDYISTSRLSPERLAEVVSGISDGCKAAGVSLLGGETAEMPGMYAEGDFDLAGFAVGIADREKLMDINRVKAGDVIIGVSSSGFHSNGYSLLRKVFFEDNGLSAADNIPGFGNVGEMLLMPTKIYANVVREVLKSAEVHSMAHITGGGFYDNLPRVMGGGLTARIAKSLIREPVPVKALRSLADIPEKELYRVFNMGVGYIFIAPQTSAEEILSTAAACGEEASVIGDIISGNGAVMIDGVE